MKKLLLKLFLVSYVLIFGFNYARAANNYTITTLTSANLNNGTSVTALYNSQPGLVIAGFKINNSGTTTLNLTSLTFKNAGTSDLAAIFPSGAITLYGVSSTVGTNAQYGKVATTNLATFTSGNTMNVTGSLSVAPGDYEYLYLVGDFVANVTTTATTNIKEDLQAITSTGPSINTTLPLAGITYNISSPITLGTATTGQGLEANNTSLTATANGIGILGFSVTTGDNETITSLQLSAGFTIGSYFSNFKLLRTTNTNGRYNSNTTTTVSGVTFSFPTPTTINITGLSDNINNSKVYYFIEADYTLGNGATANFVLSATGVGTAANSYTAGGPIAGPTLKITNPVVLGTASTAGTDFAVNPLTASFTAKGILGFSIKTTGNESFTSFQFTTSQPRGVIGTYFSNITLWESATNSIDAATQIAGALTFSPTGLNSTSLTVSLATAQTVNNATKYYFIKVNYTVPTTSTTFQLNLISASTASTTFSNAEVNGEVYYLGSPAYDWTGATNSTWDVPGNWSIAGVVQTAANAYPGGAGRTTDIANIGVNNTVVFTNNPVVAVGTSYIIGSLNIGYYGAEDGPSASYPYGIEENTSLTVDGILTVTGDITQINNNATVTGDLNKTITTIQGLTGTLTCNNFLVGDAESIPLSGEATLSEVAVKIDQLIINGNLEFNSNGNVGSGFGINGICYPSFFLQAGTTTLKGQMTFAANNGPANAAYDTYNTTGTGAFAATAPPETGHPGFGLFEMDINGDADTLVLQNATPINKANSDQFYVYFAYGGNNGTVVYNDPNPGDNQIVYTANEPSATNTLTFINPYTSFAPTAYNNLILSGASKKIIDGNSSLTVTNLSVTTATAAIAGLTVAGTLSTIGGTSDLLTHSPTVTIGGSWTNSGTALCSSGTTTTGGTFLNTSAGTFNAETGTLNFSSGAGSTSPYDYDNEGIFTYGSGTINFTGASPSLIDRSAGGTKFNNVSFSGSGTATMYAGIGNFSVANVGTLTLTSPARLVAGAPGAGGMAYLTLNSDGTSTATLSQVLSPSSISGNVNVQRWITGGGGYRGYRLFSSPVNGSASVTGANTIMGLSYINTSPAVPAGAPAGPLGAFTGGQGGPASGFTLGIANPSLYLYDDTRASSSSAYYSGKNVGIAAIGSAPGYSVSYLTTTGAVAPAAVQVPSGNAYLMYYIGDIGQTITNLDPTNTTMTATGYLNQGDVPVRFIEYNSSGPVTVGTIPHSANSSGFNQVGNPYASTINLDVVATDNPSASSIFYELNQPGGTYIAYHSDGSTSDTRASKYIVSGQGFVIQDMSSGTGSFTFKEHEKIAYPGMTAATGSTGTGTLVLDMPANPQSGITQAMNNRMASAPAAALGGLHLQLAKDSATYTQTGVYFAGDRTDAYKAGEDAIDLDGTSPLVYLSSYSSDGSRLSINELGDYSKGKRVKLYVKGIIDGLYNCSLADISNIDTNIYNIYLVDNYKKDSLDMVRYKHYAFNILNADTNSFGANRFVLSIKGKPEVPYQLLSFTGQKVSQGIALDWKTANESTYTSFVLQKQSTAGRYVTLDSLESTASGSYSYTDINPVKGGNTYRLKQTDLYGNISYASVTLLYDQVTAGGALTVYPNPARTMITVNVNSALVPLPNPDYIYTVYNMSGVAVDKGAVNSTTFVNSLGSYQPGMYIIVLKDSNGKLVGKSKFVKAE
jgi:hypothetical protein